MPIENIQINVTDVPRSVAFYRDLLDAVPVGEASTDRAVLDVVSATLELVRVDPGASTWSTDDQQCGFRHIGFKVHGLDGLVERLRAAGTLFHLDPIEAEGDVRLTFFYDPDGTHLELVERHLHYTEVVDQQLVDAEYALGTPDRPRFDHIALTVRDFPATRDHYGSFGFRHHGTILQPDPRGFRIDFLKDGDTVLEVFTFEAGTTARNPQIDVPGYVAARLAGGPTDDEVVGEGRDGAIHTDADGFTYTVRG